MPKKLYVGGLSWNTTQNDVLTKFEEFGTVEDAKLITDRDTGRSKGFAFVTFESPEDGEAAIDKLNGTEWDGRTINVSEAKERKDRGPSRGGRW